MNDNRLSVQKKILEIKDVLDIMAIIGGHYKMTKIVKLLLSVCALTFALTSCDTANSPADSTKNPGASGGTTGTVSGTVTIPATMADKPWVVLLDTDMNGDNGFTAMVNGSVTGTTFSYTLSNVGLGSYYVYAVVYAVGDGTAAPVNGDYYGIYNATGLGSPASANVVVTAGTTMTCNFSVALYSTGGGGSGGDFTVSGTITLPVSVTDKTAMITLQSEIDTEEDAEAFAFVRNITGTSFSYTVTGVPAGTYYLIATVLVDEDNLEAGFICYGFYGYGAEENPVSPNVTVSDSDLTGYNFSLYGDE